MLNRQLPESLVVLNPPGYHLWDFAGADGDQVVQQLVGAAAQQIAPFQSTMVGLDHHTGAVLRLWDANFRIALHHDMDLSLAIRQLGLNAWVQHSYRPIHPSSPMAVIVLPDVLGLELLPAIATTKPTYTLPDLPLNCAVPAYLNGIGILVWRHYWLGQPRYELQVAAAQGEALRQELVKQL